MKVFLRDEVGPNGQPLAKRSRVIAFDLPAWDTLPVAQNSAQPHHYARVVIPAGGGKPMHSEENLPERLFVYQKCRILELNTGLYREY
jgi:hypothetical protein